MAKVIHSDGVTRYERQTHHRHYGWCTSYCPRDLVVDHIKLELVTIICLPLKGKRAIKDYLLAEAAMRAGYEVEDVIGIMGGRRYGF